MPCASLWCRTSNGTTHSRRRRTPPSATPALEHYDPPREPWLHILYQDAHIIVVNKPSGLLSVPGRLPEHQDSIITRIQAQFPDAESVHRLDMATSGVLVVALTKDAERELKRQFREREPKRTTSPGSGDTHRRTRGDRPAADL